VGQAAKLRDNDTVDVPFGLEFWSDHFLPADAPTVVFNEDIWVYSPHDIHILLPFFAAVELSRREAEPAKRGPNRLRTLIAALGSEVADVGATFLP
jgi:hypothetical protein